jgi:hypothetical protein
LLFLVSTFNRLYVNSSVAYQFALPRPECRSYRFAADDEVDTERYGINCDTGGKQDFGPSLLLPGFAMCPAGTNDEEGNVDERIATPR